MVEIWRALARARVLVRINNLGAEVLANKATGRFGWRETFLGLGDVILADSDALSKVHEVVIDGGVGRPRAFVMLPEHPKAPVRLRVHWGLERAKQGDNGPLRVVEPADIATAIKGLGPRPTLAKYEFDHRFLLFVAGLGLGVDITDTDRTDADGQYLFHRVLANYGRRVADTIPAPRSLSEIQKPAEPGSLQNLQDVLGAQIDPITHPQLSLSELLTAGAGFSESMEASFPRWASSSLLFAFVHYSVNEGRLTAPDLDEIDLCMGRWIAEFLKKRGTPEEEIFRRGSWTCAIP
jgi:hypothetical protein